MNEDAEKAKKIQHNSELLRSEIIRKEATIKTLREALQKSRESLTSTEDSYAAKYHEFDRQIRFMIPGLTLFTFFRSLQRQLDILKQKCHTLEEENGSLHSQLNAFNQKIDRGNLMKSIPYFLIRCAIKEDSSRGTNYSDV